MDGYCLPCEAAVLADLERQALLEEERAERIRQERAREAFVLRHGAVALRNLNRL